MLGAMSAASAWHTDRGLPARSVRLRLTALYGGLFLACGAGLLAITYLLVSRATAIHAVATRSAGSAPARGAVVHTHLVDLHQLLVQSGIALAIMTIVSAALGWLVAGRVLRPLRSAFEAQQRFVANASHELRTPLATMRASLDVAMAKPVPAPEHIVVLENRLRRELDRLELLLEGLLALARGEHANVSGALAVALDPIAAAAVARRRPEISSLGLAVDLERCADARVRGSEALLARMVENVIDNAVLHNQPGGWVRVIPGIEGQVASLVVENGGELLAQGDVDQLAQPFRRLGAPRTGSQRGTGLGLSIVASIAQAHGGELELRARDDGGLRVAIVLPAAGTAPEARA
jgi:signal transduction histidine kinase